MSVSTPFIHRPIATSLLGVAVMLGGWLGYWWLPVSSLPQVDFPTIQVTTQLPGSSADVTAALVTAPLERQFGQIPALTVMTSSSSYGISQITLQFDLNLVVARDRVGLLRTVQRTLGAGDVGKADGAAQVLHAEPIRGEPGEIGLNAYRRADAAFDRHVPDAGELAQPLRQQGIGEVA